MPDLSPVHDREDFSFPEGFSRPHGEKPSAGEKSS
jgi:hypothetical protein